MNDLRLVFLALLIFSSQVITAGGGWPQPKGKGYYKFSEWWLISDQHYTDSGMIDPNITNGIFNTSIYAEYGLTDRLTGILYFPFFSRTYNNNIVSGTTGEILQPGEAINSIGDTDISLKYGLTQPGSGISVAAMITFGLPLGNDSGGNFGSLQTGDGEFNQIVTLDAGTGGQIGGTPVYTNLSLGFNNRTKDFSDEVRYSWEIGTHLLNRKLWVIGRLFGVESLKNGADASVLSNATSIFANNAEYTSYGVEVAYNIGENWGISVGTAGAFRGEIIFASRSYTVGVFANL